MFAPAPAFLSTCCQFTHFKCCNKSAATARRLRGEDAHGGRAGNGSWLRLNFPSKREAGRAKALGMPAR